MPQADEEPTLINAAINVVGIRFGQFLVDQALAAGEVQGVDADAVVGLLVQGQAGVVVPGDAAHAGGDGAEQFVQVEVSE